MTNIEALWRNVKNGMQGYRRVGRVEHGYLGDGLGNIIPDDRPAYRYVRVERPGGLTVGVFRGDIRAREGMPVIIATDPLTKEQVIIGADWDAAVINGNEDDVLLLQQHARTHEWSPEADDRMDWLHPQQLSWLRVQADNTTPQQVIIQAGVYFANNKLIWKDAVDTLDLSAHYPPSGAVWILISIDDNKHYTVSAAESQVSSLTTIPWGECALSAVKLTAGTDFGFYDFIPLWQINQFDASALGGEVMIEPGALVLNITGYPSGWGEWTGLLTTTIDGKDWIGNFGAFDSDFYGLGLIDEGADRKDTLLVFGDNTSDLFRIARWEWATDTLTDLFTMDAAGNITPAAGATFDGVDVGTDVPLNTTHRGLTDNPHTVIADQVDITDAGGYYTATEVEAALQEIGNGTTLDGLYTPRDEWLQNGFASLITSTLTWSDSGPDRTLSLQPTATDFNYWVEGVEYISAGDTKQIANTEGIWVFYYDAAGLQAVNSPTAAEVGSIIRTKALVSILYWDVSAAAQIYFGEERHGKGMSPETHAYLHFLQGLAYLSGLGLNTMDVDGSGDFASSIMFGIDAGSVADEDLYKNIAAVPASAGLPVYYMTGATATWNKQIKPLYSAILTGVAGEDRIAFNEYAGGAWQLSETTHDNYCLYHVFATTEINTPMISVMGQNEYATKSAARAGALTEIRALISNELPFPEIRPVASVIYEAAIGYSNALGSRIVSTDAGDDYIDWRHETISRSRVEVSTADHARLTSLPWASSGHTGAASTTPAFDSGGTAIEIQNLETTASPTFDDLNVNSLAISNTRQLTFKDAATTLLSWIVSPGVTERSSQIDLGTVSTAIDVLNMLRAFSDATHQARALLYAKAGGTSAYAVAISNETATGDSYVEISPELRVLGGTILTASEDNTVIGANVTARLRINNTHTADLGRFSEIQFGVGDAQDLEQIATISARATGYSSPPDNYGGDLFISTKGAAGGTLAERLRIFWNGLKVTGDIAVDDGAYVGIPSDVRVEFDSTNGHIDLTLDDAAGGDEVRVVDSAGVAVATIDSDGNGYFAGKIGIGKTPAALLDLLTTAAVVAHQINLANGQTANALEINSDGGSDGDLFKVDADGGVNVVTNMAIGSGAALISAIALNIAETYTASASAATFQLVTTQNTLNSQAFAVIGRSKTDGSNNISHLYGVHGSAYASTPSAITVGALYGVTARFGINKTGSSVVVKNAYGFYVDSPVRFSGNITRAYGMRIKSIDVASHINFGIYLDPVSGATSNYAIYTCAGQVHFGDNVNTVAEYSVDGTQVVTNQQAAIADVPTGGSATAAANATAINSILAMLRTHGLIAT